MADLSAVYNRLNGVSQYHPFSANTFADWASEAGDTVKISREGTEYSAPVHKQSLVWRGKHAISMESTGTKERTAIERVSNTKETTTSSGVSSARSVTGGAGSAIKALQYDFYDPEGKYESQLYMDEQRFTTIFTKTGIDGLPAGTSLSTMINQNAEQISLEAIRAYEQETLLSGRITVEAGRITQEVTNRENKDNELQGKITVEANRITQEVTDRRGDVEALSGRIIVQANRITQEVTDRTNSYNTLNGKITVEAGKIEQIVSAVGADGQVTAASITLAINEGRSGAWINADNVWIGNSKSTTVINGKLNASDVTADYIQSKIAQIADVAVQNLHSERGGVNVNSVSTTSFYQGSVSCYVPHAITSLQIVSSGNTYTLQRKWFSESDWTNVGSFSRAVSSWSVGGGSGKVNVTANPQSQTKSVPVSIGGSNRISSNGTYTYKVYYENADGDDVETGASMDVAVNITTAITSWSVTGGNAAVKVTAQPQNQSKSVNLAVSGPGSITSNGTYTYKAMYEDNDGDDADSGAFRNVTVDVPTGGVSVGSVDLTAIAVSTYQPTGYDGAVYLTELPNAIKNNRNTYVWFKVRVYDDQGEKLYTKNYYCASA